MAISRAKMRQNLDAVWDDIFVSVAEPWIVWAEYDINTMTWTPRKIEKGGSSPTMKCFRIDDAVDEMDAYKQFMEKFSRA